MNNLTRKRQLLVHINAALELQDQLIQAARHGDTQAKYDLKDRYTALLVTLPLEELFELVAESGEKKASA